MENISQILQMIFIMSFLLLSLLHNSHIFTVDAFSSDAAKGHLFFMEDNGDGTQSLQMEKVLGEDDENEENQVSVVENFRALLGLKRSHNKIPSNVSPSPSPSPFSEAEARTAAPAPAPKPHIHPHSHGPHRLRSVPKPNRIDTKHEGRIRKILVYVLVSAGAAIVICVFAVIWAWRKYKNKKKQIPARVISSVYRKKGGAGEGAARKVSLNLANKTDLVYLDSLGTDLEQQQEQQISCNKESCESVNNTLHEADSNPKLIKTDFDDDEYNASCSSSTREITIMSDCDKIIRSHAYASDEESFHSLADSNSLSIRLSDASAGSLGDTSDALSTNMSFKEDQPETLTENPNQDVDLQSQINAEQNCLNNFGIPPRPPPLPPPPPPTPIKLFTHFHSSSSSCLLASKASCSSSTLPILSPPRKSNSSSGSNQAPDGGFSASSPQKPPIIPPPPCPPPFSNPNISLPKGPPPPPLPSATTLGKDGTPLPKLKPLHWDKVRSAPDHSMVWDKLRTSSFELDEEMIESLFGYNLQKSMNSDESKSKNPSPSKHVLEPKRLQNITILSKAINSTADQVCEALIQGNGLGLQQLEALVRMEPTKEEEEKLSGYKGDINELGSAERFVKDVLKVPSAFLRVEAMLYKETFEDEVVHLKNSFSVLEEACKELRSSRLFLKLLEAVLKTGNRMNVGTIRGGAKAFKLDTLLKLSDVKGTDGKTTLLHFVVQEIIRSEGIRVSDSIMGKIGQRNKTKSLQEKEDDYRKMGLDLVSGLSTELYNVKKTATLDLDALATSVSNLSDGMKKIKDLCAADEEGGSLVNTMRTFLNYAEKSLKELQGGENGVLSHVKEITEYFHGNVSKEEGNPLRIFVIVRDFLGMLDHVCKELRGSKAARTPNPLAPFR